MTQRLLFDRCLTGHRHPKVIRAQKLRYFNVLSGFILFDRCLTEKAQRAETQIMGLSGKLFELITVKESLTVRYGQNRCVAEARQTDTEEIAESERVEKQLEQKKVRR